MAYQARAQQPIAAAPLAGIYRVMGTNPGGGEYRGMVTIGRHDDEFTFKWWIGGQTFIGTGHFSSDALTVDWGDKDPVIYQLGQPGKLDGQWAGGKASEQLVLYARSADGAGKPIEGDYQADGLTPGGGKYAGRVHIARNADRFIFDWTIGEERYHGEGVLDGNLLFVDWGDATPVIYARTKDGSLRGLWSAGLGEEILSPQ